MAESDSGGKPRGFAAMPPEKKRAIAQKGGQASGGKFSPGSQRARDAGRKGALNQPREAKERGGEHSHRSNSS